MKQIFIGIAILSTIACTTGYFIQSRQDKQQDRIEGIRGVITEQTCPVCGATMTRKAEIITKVNADSTKGEP